MTTWPLTFQTSDGNAVSIFQPQPDKLAGDALSGRAAISVTPPGTQDPIFGAVWFAGRLITDSDSRTATLTDVQVQQAALPSTLSAQQGAVSQAVQEQLSQRNVSFALDALHDSLGVAEKEQANVASLQTDAAEHHFQPARRRR